MQHVPVAEVLERRLFLDAVPAGPKFFVNEPRGDEQRSPAVAADAAGNFVVAWEADRQVWARRFDAAGNPRAPEVSLGLGSRPAVAMDADGDHVIAWQQGELQYSDLLKVAAARFDASGVGQSLGQVVTTPHPGAATSPAVAMSPGGDFVITWTTDFEPQWGIVRKSRVYARLYDAAGQPRGPDFRVSVIERTTEMRLKSSVGMDADGNFAVTWYQLTPQLPWELTSRRFTATGEPLEEPVVLDRGLYPRVAPGVAMDADGDFVVLWQKGDSKYRGEWFWRRYDDSLGAWGDTTPLAPGERSGADRPAIDIDADGNFVISWAAGVAREVFVYAQCFTPAGKMSGERIVVEAQDYDEAINPAVAMDEQGNFVVAWDQWTGARDYDVMARRYTGAAVPQPPRVTDVMVGGTAWSIRFLYALETRGLGSRRWGFAIPGGAEQGRPLPWVNLNQVTVRFDRDVTVPADALLVTGAGGRVYPFAASGGAPAFAYDASARTATWTLGRSVGADGLSFTIRSGAAGVHRTSGGGALDGDWLGAADAWPSGDGAEGGDFRLALNVLPGDVTRDGRVTAADVLKVRAARQAEVDDPRAPADAAFRDVNGSNQVILSDEVSVRRSLGRTLPPPTLDAAAARPRRTAPLTRGFFGESANLAELL